MKCSVLIITKNRAKVLAGCLPALVPQLGNSHELVIVDSSENDDTQALIQRYPQARYFRVQLGPGTRPQSYSYGAARCTGDVVALIDDDAIPHARWIDELLRLYSDSAIGAVGGRVLSNNPESAIPAHVKPEEVGSVRPDGRVRAHCYWDGPDPLEVDTLRGCNMSVRRSLFDRIGYFDNRYTGQNCRVEDDICLRIKRAGHKVMYNPKAVVTHLAAERVDVPRASDSPRSVFYVARNTVYLYLKNVGWRPKLLWHLLVWNPLIDGARYSLIGGLKRFRGISPHGIWLALVNWWGCWVGLGASIAALVSPRRIA